MSLAAPTPDTRALQTWLDAHADSIDTGRDLAHEILPQLGRAGVLGIGAPAHLGGSDGFVGDAIEAVAKVAEQSLAAAFVFWGQRTFIEYVLQSPNTALRDRWLPTLLSGELAGATGLSNAMKYLSNIEALQMRANRLAPADGHDRWELDGALPWITNLRREGFLAAAAFEHTPHDSDDADDGAPPSIFAIPHDAPGVSRSEDLDLIGLRSSNTAALTLDRVVLDDTLRITADAPAWLARVRPSFLGLQCGMSIGLIRRCLAEVDDARPIARAAVAAEASDLKQQTDLLTQRLNEGIIDGAFVRRPADLFDIRIALAAAVQAAVGLEVQVTGGRGYLRGQTGTARRMREAAFLPIITPSVVQLKHQLALHRNTGTA